MTGYAAAVSGDEEEAYAAIDYLGRSFDDGRAPPWAMRLAGTLDDVETVLAILGTFPAEDYVVHHRFNLDHSPQFDGVRDDPRFQAFMDRLPPYYVPEN